MIGAINDAAVGIGATMTLPMDFLVASDTARFSTARFSFVFAQRGIVPEAVSGWFPEKRQAAFSDRVSDAVAS